MAHVTPELKQHLLAVIRGEYEECAFFTAAANMLTHKFKEIAQRIETASDLDFSGLRDLILEIGPLLGNTEKRLQDVDECYTKLVEALAAGKPDA